MDIYNHYSEEFQILSSCQLQQLNMIFVKQCIYGISKIKTALICFRYCVQISQREYRCPKEYNKSASKVWQNTNRILKPFGHARGLLLQTAATQKCYDKRQEDFVYLIDYQKDLKKIKNDIF